MTAKTVSAGRNLVQLRPQGDSLPGSARSAACVESPERFEELGSEVDYDLVTVRPERRLKRPAGYISDMTEELRDLMAHLELSLVDTVARLEKTEMDLLYVGVLDLEQRIEALQDALAFVADSIAAETPANELIQRLPRPAPPGGGAGD
jgi:hypothetical protein